MYRSYQDGYAVRGERTYKYNQPLRIKEDLDKQALYELGDGKSLGLGGLPKDFEFF